MSIWRSTDQDRELFRRELDSFVPERIFDSHVHIYNVDYFPQDDIPAGLVDGPRVVDAGVYLAHMAELLPGRTIGGLVFPFPRGGLRMAEANRFAAQETAKIPNSRAQMMVAPNDDPEMIRETVRSLGLVGLKCYHLYSPVTPTFDSPIEAFLPEEQVRVAHEEKLSITLHIVKQRSLADPQNQRTLRRYAETYPDMRLILAHAARGFNPHHTAEGIGSLTGLPNVYFDTGAVTDYGRHRGDRPDRRPPGCPLRLGLPCVPHPGPRDCARRHVRLAPRGRLPGVAVRPRARRVRGIRVAARPQAGRTAPAPDRLPGGGHLLRQRGEALRPVGGARIRRRHGRYWRHACQSRSLPGDCC